jgi:hypothetical protein
MLMVLRLSARGKGEVANYVVKSLNVRCSAAEAVNSSTAKVASSDVVRPTEGDVVEKN